MSESTRTSTAVIRGAYFHDLMKQPGALRSTLNAISEISQQPLDLEAWSAQGIRRVVLTGMGSSLFALYPLHLRISAGEVPSFHVETAELLTGYEGLQNDKTLLVAVSQSGESAEVVKLLENRESFGGVIGVTNDSGSTLGRKADLCLELRAGEESTVSCKTYLCTLAMLHWLGACLTGGDPTQAMEEVAGLLPWIEEYLESWEGHVADLMERLQGVTDFFITGRGNSLATTGTGGLILKESTRRHAEGMSCPAFRHGPLEMVSDQVFVLAFGGSGSSFDLNRRLVEDVQAAGGRAAFCAAEGASAPAFQMPFLSPALHPLAEMLLVQMMSLAIAALDQWEAGTFEHASKVTSID